MEPNEKQNTFEKMAKEQQDNPTTEAVKAPKELSSAFFSDVAVGDKVKYVRPNLDGSRDVVDMFQVFEPDTTKPPELTKNKDKEYWVPEIILFWDSENDDGIQNKEYISGGRVWKNRDGTPSEINFWYEDGADNNNQSCILWETVAKAIGIKPKEMSPRQFIAFLNGKPKFEVKKLEVNNFNAPKGSPAHIYKNMPGKLVTE